jgi:hypothetical protein
MAPWYLENVELYHLCHVFEDVTRLGYDQHGVLISLRHYRFPNERRYSQGEPNQLATP